MFNLNPKSEAAVTAKPEAPAPKAPAKKPVAKKPAKKAAPAKKPVARKKAAKVTLTKEQKKRIREHILKGKTTAEIRKFFPSLTGYHIGSIKQHVTKGHYA